MMILLACLFVVAVVIGSYVAVGVTETLRGDEQKL
jgi:hypothetical protein